mmetsp:Transcript_111984/g.194429  ORF Transcript_111984/g.194429 Transcript_111984/m.194429 type:complete len:886 (-) Transcript_111984:1248-3905(-)
MATGLPCAAATGGVPCAEVQNPLGRSLRCPPLDAAPFRLQKIEVYRSDAIDQIKFTYDDNTVWSYGHDGGKADARVVVLTAGEYVVSVTHERFVNFRAAGAAVVFRTNKGREFGYFPRRMATKKASEQTTIKAAPGHEILSLKIKRGVLKGIVEQEVPEHEACYEPKPWYTVTTLLPKEDRDVALEHEHFEDKKQALKVWQQVAQQVSAKVGRAAILIDCISTKVLKQAGNKSAVEQCVAQATADGLCASKQEDDLSMWDALKTLVQLLGEKHDLLVFIVVTGSLAGSSYLGLQAKVLAGQVLTIAETGADTHTSDWFVLQVCLPLVGGTPHSSTDVSRALILALVLVKFAERLLYGVNVYIHHTACDRKNQRLRDSVFRHVLSMDQSFFDTHSTSEIRGGMNVHTLSNLVTWVVPYIFNNLLRMVLVVYFMVSINVGLAIICVSSMLAVKFGLLDQLGKREAGCHKLRRKLDRMTEQVEDDAMDLVSSIKLFSNESQHLAEHGEGQGRVMESIHMIVLLRCIREFGYGILQVVTFGAVLYYGLKQVSENGIPAADLTSFFFIFTDVQDIFGMLRHFYDILIQDMPDIHRYLSLVDKRPQLQNGTQVLGPVVSGDIQFHDVWFQYPARPGEDVLKGLNLQLQPNKMTAIVGDSGAGKSTVSRLLMRLYDPKAGRVTLDGHDLRNLDTKSLRDQIAIVNQSPDLFGASIGENIAYGAGRPVTQEEIEDAARLANCYDFIMKFRAGFDTYVGGKGSALSGGQKQRIAIARAAIRNPKILILDEATSALDAENERLVQAALERITKGRTTLVIAHRLSTIRHADEIVCMRDGMVVEQGTHDELLQRRGVYARLIGHQIIDTDRLHQVDGSSPLSRIPSAAARTPTRAH